MLLAQVWAAIVGAALAIAALGLFLAWSVRRLPGQRRADNELAALFLLRDGRSVDASPSGEAVMSRLDRSASSEADGIPWPELSAVLSRVFPDLTDAMPEDGARFEARDGSGLVLVARMEAGTIALHLQGEDRKPVAALEQALMRSELDDLREGLSRAPFPIWRTDALGEVTWANLRYRTLSEQTGLAPLVPTRSADEADRISARVELADPPRDGPRWLELTSKRAARGWLHYAVDIDAVVNAEQAQRNFVQTLAKTFSHLPTGLAIFDRLQKLMLFNPALTDLTGLTAEELAGRPDLMSFFDMLRERQIMPEPRDYANWRQELSQMISASKDGGYSDTWSLPSGLTFRITGRPHPDGAVAFLIEDISDEVSLTRRFRRELELSQSVIDAFDDAIAVFTAGGILAFSNSGYREMWDSDPDEALHSISVIDATRHWQSLSEPTPFWGEVRDFVRQHGERARWDGEVLRTDGRKLTCHVEPIHGGGTLVRFVECPDAKARQTG
ncbi:hypothetical protein OCH239_15435 [Roseivivax halodurans JCM 10272]|uniref:PAS domain-containing protein n=1 Tax=Roseivivax halodurans JCM 10272 TaxID=1449350 RepID=X7ECK2_9RHOB|nr:PAS-domain containing protein [Roseivivax halodurans]ETX12886.1 hypothetical protein OCH239_15435 [Roseivivax halodurans JCM 10272]